MTESELSRLLREAAEHFTETPSSAQWLVPEPTVRKLSAFMPVSCCVLTDATGENHCEHPQPARPPCRRRLRWWIRARWAAVRLRVGSWVAGVDLAERDDW